MSATEAGLVNLRKAGPREPADDFARWIEPSLPAAKWLAARLAPGDDADVVQEALLRVWQKRAQFDPARGTQRAWVLAIVADQARKHLGRERPLSLQVARDVPPGPAERVDLERAVARLPERQLLAVTCFYFVDLTIAETAVVMTCSEGTVKSTLFDARTRLRKDLGREQP